jgi:putative ABC transport system permease protein
MGHLTEAIRLSSKDYFREWRISGAYIIALAAVLGPMMVLFGLKFGVVGGMIEDLVKDPRNREITLLGNGRFGPDWFAQMQQRSDIAFLVPRTRRIAASMEMTTPGSGRITAIELIPSGPGDPLLENVGQTQGLNRIVLSKQAAQRLQVNTGDRVSASVSRRFQGQAERQELQLTVAAIAPAVAFNREGAFVSLELLEAVEDFRDGRQVAALGWGGLEDKAERVYPGFRLYAADIRDVAGLSQAFMAQGMQVRTRADDIEVVQDMDRNLTVLFWAIAVIGLAGFSLSLGASLLANVDRKRKELSVLRLVGLSTGDIVLFPMLQALYTALIGWVMATGIFYGVSHAINVLFADQLQGGQSLCRLLPEHLLIALGLTTGCAIMAAFLGGVRASRIEPSEGLRDL